MLPKMSAYRRDFDEIKMSFLIKNDELREKTSKVIKNGFDSEPVYNNRYLKTKVKSYERKINTNSHDNKMPKEGSQYICLSVSLIDSFFRASRELLSSIVFRRMLSKKKDA